MKVIFLDIDGVLNSYQTFRDIHDEYKKTGIRRVAIDEEKVILLKEIVDETGAFIVLSSSWRKLGKMVKNKLITKNKNLNDLLDILEKYGLYIYDITPNSRTGNRELEIRKWLSNKDIESFIVIDDDSYDLIGFIGKELVKTSFIKSDGSGNYLKDKSGLTKDHVEEAIYKLNNISLEKGGYNDKVKRLELGNR